jgi:hypothetical protein
MIKISNIYFKLYISIVNDRLRDIGGNSYVVKNITKIEPTV